MDASNEQNYYGLHEISIRLLEWHADLFTRVDPHETPTVDDPETSDNLILTRPISGGTDEEIIGVNPLRGGGWSAWHLRCIKCGAWPMVWEVRGSADFVLGKMSAYLSDTTQEANISAVPSVR
ncbi:hypothetical protein SGO26_30265 (plasmid) [Cupriavidus metallidurans]|uniref:hypothetical protein n=1 Tax=Cupriavidus metallidurans TaxID=119219 RepID=UPI003D7511F1